MEADPDQIEEIVPEYLARPAQHAHRQPLISASPRPSRRPSEESLNLKQAQRYASQTIPEPVDQPRLAFDFSTSHPQRIFSNETVKQHLLQRAREDKDRSDKSQKISIAPSITLSLFTHLTDPSLSWATKLGCFGATLGINFLLPFINGVMLGFGEIAAREFLGVYFGWGPAGYRYYSKQTQNPSQSSGQPSSNHG
ncbi:hypothetical protein PTTG_26454 [Puccinia triticina 1-1 BBBD Race 1]|uniref:Uncharacterized protein n=2 Tax=Puccinia triticina TaxID=208348 RepID=A0A180GU61_PUCT1|nr:uncharacterized protein PtA15_5A291 [Puccinia triticina]OAV96064.1 hypothetical protein PTTG_26454 [Puccinia triticina 1-1 BBBD Race 1]WAQ84718.1 hypothetical protein PtA15_5A291 [Puccinia triticina]WAR58063.1 hypothetical protein PtB15_5B295 [Puccinia triticina]